MGRTYKHNKHDSDDDNDYTQSNARGSLNVERHFASADKSKSQNKKKRDKQFRKNRKVRELKLNQEQEQG